MIAKFFALVLNLIYFSMGRWWKIIKNSTLLKIRLSLAFLLAVIISFFLLAKVVPSGKIVYSRDYSRSFFGLGGQGFLSLFSPADRIDAISGAYPRFLADPIYFSVFTPRRFERARLIIKYQDALSDNTPLIEAGVLKDKMIWSYQMKPIENKILDSLSWPSLRDGSLVLYQRSEKVKDLSVFQQDVAGRNDLALYNYTLNKRFYLPDYQAGQSSRIVASALRGPYQFYTYIDNESLNFIFYFQDLNQNYDLKGDGINIVVRDQAGKNILSREISDDGIIVDSGDLGPEKISSFIIKDLPRGVYRIEVKTNDDILTKKIISTQSKLSFINKVWLEDSDSGSKSTEIYTNADYIKATAFGASGLQNLFFQDKAYKIDAPFQQFSFKTKNGSGAGAYRINAKPKNLILENNGVFAFSPEALVIPDFPKVDGNWSDSPEINYILAEYEQPQSFGEDKLAVLDFDLSDAYREKGKYGFMISIPGLYADNQNRAAIGLDPAYLQVKEIRVELAGQSLGQKIKELFKRLYD
ncbi:MAG: hypothetical protein WC441_00295 [Patescibacteria group bacterium]